MTNLKRAKTSATLRARRGAALARKNYWARTETGALSYYTAIRIPQAIENNKLEQKALEGRLEQDQAIRLERAALDAVRRLARDEADLEAALNGVMAYWTALNWSDEMSPAKRSQALDRQRSAYARTLKDKPWESCRCTVCREGGVEALIFRSSNRNKRRELGLRPLVGRTSWTSGDWVFEDERRPWNGLQNVPRDIHALTRHLLRLLKRSRAAAEEAA